MKSIEKCQTNLLFIAAYAKKCVRSSVFKPPPYKSGISPYVVQITISQSANAFKLV